MLLRAAHIKNFRSLREITVNFGRQTTLVGENGAGKSSVLRAIELFYAKSLNKIKDADFFDINFPIEIELTFYTFTEEEHALFSSRIINNTMTIARVIERNGGKGNGGYYGMTNIHGNFQRIRGLQGVEKRTAFNDIAGQGDYQDLPRAARVVDIDDLLVAWEAAHPDACALGRDDGRFFGFSNVARGQLQKATSFVLVPAVRDASEDAQDSKNTAIGQLMEIIVRSSIHQRQDIKKFEAEYSAKYEELTSAENLPELGAMENDISVTLQQMYADAAVSLNWRKSEAFSLPLPAADVSLLDDDIKIPVEYAGHGLQRAFVIALLQHLARASFTSVQEELPPEEGHDDAAQLEVLDQEAAQLPGLILAIEEPELFQHPTKQRHFARVLHDLSHGHLPGMATSTQMILATHSPYFVAIDRSEEVRLMRRTVRTAGQTRETLCKTVELGQIAAQLEQAKGLPEGTFTAQSLKPRLHIIGPELSEGFFAKAVVLVEGPGDKAALCAAAKIAERRFEEAGIAVLSVGSKNNLDRPWAIFSSLGIPVYVLWDGDVNLGDKKKSEASQNCNLALQKLLAVPEPHHVNPSFVRSTCACLHDKLESVMEEEIGIELFAQLVEEKVAIYELRDRKSGLKNPEIIGEVLSQAAEKGAYPQTLNEIIGQIFSLLDEPDNQPILDAA